MKKRPATAVSEGFEQSFDLPRQPGAGSIMAAAPWGLSDDDKSDIDIEVGSIRSAFVVPESDISAPVDDK